MVDSVVLIGSDGTRHTVTASFTVGRVPERDLCIDDSRVSRLHAELRHTEAGVTVEDKGSSNGTKVNGLPAIGVTAIKHGDAVSFDVHVFLVEFDGRPVNELDDDDHDAGADVTQIRIPMDDTPAPSVAVPDAWTEKPSTDHTQFLAAGALGGGEGGVATPTRMFPGAHLIVFSNTSAAEGVELPVSADGSQDVWEIGRADTCDLSFEDHGMSLRHAQLVHEGGRWRMVNLVSTNGIIVNGEKRLSVYLADGDVIQLGTTQLVFYGVEGAVPQRAKPGKSAPRESGGGKPWLIPVAVGALVVIALGAAFALGVI